VDQKKRETESQKKVFEDIKRQNKKREKTAEKKQQVPVNYNKMKEDSDGNQFDHGSVMKLDELAQEDEIADFFMRDTENLHNYGSTFDY